MTPEQRKAKSEEIFSSSEGTMGKKLPPDQMELYRKVDEVLTYVWDPIGVARVPQTRNEYQGYLPEVFGLVLKEESPDEISNCLLRIETESMGFDNTKNTRRGAMEVAQLLLEHWDWIKQKHGTS